MRKLALFTLGIVGGAGALLAMQQQYPNATAEVVFENDQVVVQRVVQEADQWSGEHSHAGNQIAVVLKGATLTYKQGGEESTRTFEAGEVFWVDAVEAHDHKSNATVESLLITIK